MTCPRCGREWDVTKSPCSRCGLFVQLPTSAKRAEDSSNLSSPAFSSEKDLSRPTSSHEREKGVPPSRQIMRQEKTSTGTFQQRAIPHRPQVTSPLTNPIDPALFEILRQQQPMFRPSRLLLSSPGEKKESSQAPSTSSFEPFVFPLNEEAKEEEDRPPIEETGILAAGMLLHDGRYRLQGFVGRQNWKAGIYETMWYAQDAQRSGTSVAICEVFVPESSSIAVQGMLRTATIALTSAGRHPHIPTLWDVFHERERSFFVFEPIEGESLLGRMRRTGYTLPERDVIECCVQIAELLEQLSLQTPPLVHGLIRPDYIIARADGQYVLRCFSTVLAGGATQFVTDLERSYLSTYTVPEWSQGMVDGGADLYSLLATAYYAVTGSVPVRADDGYVPAAQRLNPRLSPLFDAILSRGLHPVVDQRYQRPSELRQALLAILPGSARGRMQNTGPHSEHFTSPQPSVLTPRGAGAAQNQSGSYSLQGLSGPLPVQFGGRSVERKAIQWQPVEERKRSPRMTRQMVYWVVGSIVILVALLLIRWWLL